MVTTFNWIKVGSPTPRIIHMQTAALPATVALPRGPVLIYHKQLEVMTIYGYYTDGKWTLMN